MRLRSTPRGLLLAALTGPGLLAACFSNSGTAPDAGFDGDFGDVGFAGESGGGRDATPGDATLDSPASDAAPPDAGSEAAAETGTDAGADAPADAGHEAAADAAHDAPHDAPHDAEGGTSTGRVAGGTALAWPTGLAFAGSTLYWLDSSDPAGTNQGLFESCTPSGGHCTPKTLPGLTGMPPNPQLATDGTTHFFPLGAPASSGTTDRLYTCPVAGCSAGSLASLGNVGYWGDLTGVAVYGPNLYYAGGSLGSANYAVLVGNKDGTGSGSFLVTGLTRTANLAVDASNLYFSLVSGGIYSCPVAADAGTSTCSPVLVQSTGSTSGLAIDATSIYWGDPAAGTIHRCPLAGCGASKPVDIATGIGHVNSLALSGSYLFYSVGDSADGGASNGIFAALK